MKKQYYVLIVVGIIIVVALGYYFYYKKEHYSNIGDLDNVGSIESSYDLIPASESMAPAAHFADLVNAGQNMQAVKQPDNNLELLRPMERLERLQGSQLLPRIAAQATPYNVSVADPLTHTFSVNSPRVQLKDPVWTKSDPYRGDIPITYYPNVALVAKSQYGRSSQNFSGFFSDGLSQLYNKFTGKGYLSSPIKVSNEETIMDYVA